MANEFQGDISTPDVLNKHVGSDVLELAGDECTLRPPGKLSVGLLSV